MSCKSARYIEYEDNDEFIDFRIDVISVEYEPLKAVTKSTDNIYRSQYKKSFEKHRCCSDMESFDVHSGNTPRIKNGAGGYPKASDKNRRQPITTSSSSVQSGYETYHQKQRSFFTSPAAPVNGGVGNMRITPLGFVLLVVVLIHVVRITSSSFSNPTTSLLFKQKYDLSEYNFLTKDRNFTPKNAFGKQLRGTLAPYLVVSAIIAKSDKDLADEEEPMDVLALLEPNSKGAPQVESHVSDQHGNTTTTMTTSQSSENIELGNATTPFSTTRDETNNDTIRINSNDFLGDMQLNKSALASKNDATTYATPKRFSTLSPNT